MSNKKAEVMRDVLKANLAIRVPSLALASSVDGNGDAVLSVGTVAAGNQCAVIRIKADAPFAAVKDILGLTQTTWNPNLVQIALESSVIANGTILANPSLFLILAECLLLGCVTELYLETTANAPATTSMVASKLSASFSNSLQFGHQAAI